MKSTACGPSYDYPGDENFLKLKDCTRDARARLASFVFIFSRKFFKSILVSFRFLSYSYTDHGTSIFFAKKKKSITTILTIKNMKSVYLSSEFPTNPTSPLPLAIERQ